MRWRGHALGTKSDVLPPPGREEAVNLGCETSRGSSGDASGWEEAGRIWEEGGEKGQGGQGAGRRESTTAPLQRDRWHWPAEQKGALRNQKDGEKTR